MPEKQVVAALHERIAAWYQRAGRKALLWRKTEDAYAIYISEIMLQQTQVETVEKRYYRQFLQRFPTLEAVAAAHQDAVLKAWEGLGYYTRAVNLQRTAQRLVAEAGGKKARMPQDAEALLVLPGIGKNTAHAILAFAYHQPVAVMEANLRRVLARVFALKTPRAEELWEKAEALLDRADPFTHNQAMMDIGALVCTKKGPRCGECPLAEICQGKATPEAYPAPVKKRAVPVREQRIVVFYNDKGEYYITPRKTAFLHGLYGFPQFKAEEEMVFLGTAYAPEMLRYVGEVTQTYSHFKLAAEVYCAYVEAAGEGFKEASALHHLPLSRADQKVVRLLETYDHQDIQQEAKNIVAI